MRRATILLVIATLLHPLPADAQETDPLLEKRPVVSVDFSGSELSDFLPFGEDFFLKAPVPSRTDSVWLDVYRIEADAGGRWHRAQTVGSLEEQVSSFFDQKNVSFLVPGLDAGQQYRFVFRYRHNIPSGLTTAVAFVTDSVSALTEYSPAAHVDFDLGALLTVGAGYFGSLSSAHFHLRPIDPRERWPWRYDEGWDRFAQTVSLFVGVSLVEFNSDVDVEKLFGDGGSPAVGIGFRVHRDVRVQWGMIFFEQSDPNPLVNRKIGRQDNFIAASWNIDYKALLGPLVGLLGLK